MLANREHGTPADGANAFAARWFRVCVASHSPRRQSASDRYRSTGAVVAVLPARDWQIWPEFEHGAVRIACRLWGRGLS